MEKRLAQAMELEDMVYVEDETVFAETKENEVPILGPLGMNRTRRWLLLNKSTSPLKTDELLVEAWRSMLVQLVSVSEIVEVARCPAEEVERFRWKDVRKKQS
jgi:hypothetical protein